MILALLIHWIAVTTDCRDALLTLPVDHYEVVLFEAKIIGSYIDPDSGNLIPIYSRSLARSTATPLETEMDVEPLMGDVVGWDGMWDAAWRLAPPTIVTVVSAGNRSDDPCL
jgi:hypothetical protein